MNIISRLRRRTKQQLRKIVNHFRYESVVDLERSQWWSYEKLRQFQNQRLKKILSYAYENIPAYKIKFEQAGLTPQDIHCIDDLVKLPITTREEMQDNENFINKKLITGELCTGGSTGATLRYFESYESGKIRWNVHLRGWKWNGYEYNKDKLAIVASAQGVVRGEKTLNLLGDLRESNIKENLQRLFEFRPQYIRGYVGSLYILAKYCLDNDIKIDFIKSINPISENLYDFQREIIEHGFGGKVFEEYCCNDGGACAWECEAHEGLHYVMERAIIEQVDGEMVVTDLWNKAMPFIRYCNGDWVTFLGRECSCGRKLPLIKVKGRANDIIISSNGPISPTFLMTHGVKLRGPNEEVTYFRSGISSVQYIQRPGYNLDIYLVRNNRCSDKEIEDFISNIQKIVDGMTVTIHTVDSIPATPKGKRQFIINEDKELLKKWGY